MDNITRGALVTQLGTAVRNAETVVARLGMDTLTSALDNALARAVGRFTGSKPQAGALDGLETFLNTVTAVRPKNFKSHKAFLEEIGKAFPSAPARLLSSFNSDIKLGSGGGILGGAEKLVQMANVFNRGQEFLIRRAVFQSKLAQEVRRLSGQNIDDIIKRGAAFEIPEEAVNKAVERALEVTFGAIPKHGTASRLFTDLINKTAPLSTLAIPFPRFLTQSLKFTAEHTPLGFLRLLSPVERARIAQGDLSGMAKAIVGSGL
ncbi:MAG: hypothetical protein L0312_28840, partial [Acidobacteria bacterium]|nr:hypothetical protein [Acidobacteriota bacterium]